MPRLMMGSVLTQLGEEKETILLVMFYDLARTNDVRMSSDWSLRSSFEGVRSRVVRLAETGFRQRKNLITVPFRLDSRRLLAWRSNARKKTSWGAE